MPRKSSRNKQPLLPFPEFKKLVAAAGSSTEARDTLRSMLRVHRTRSASWRGQNVVPPDTFLDVVTSAFRAQTDIPLELPLAVTMTLVSGRLLRAGCGIDINGQRIKPILWTLALAASGAGKSYVLQRVLDIAGPIELFPDPGSAAQFVQDLAAHNRSVWVRDEFGQFLKSLDQQTHMAELRDYLLRLYDGQTISRRTKSDPISIQDPALVILGTTVLETFKDCVSPESLVDGFAQRYNFIVAPPDPSRCAADFPLYDLRPYEDAMRTAWSRIEELPLHPIYRVGTEAVEAFKIAFKDLMPADQALPLSFFRRVMFSGIRYAAVYHLLLGDECDEITARDMGWAIRMVSLHLEDARQILDGYGLSELERVVCRVEQIKAEVEASGRKCKPRDLIRRIAAIKTANEAKALLHLTD